MSKLRVESFSVSVDGFSAALNQSLQNPFGEGGMELPKWAIATDAMQKMFGRGAGTTGIDNAFASRGFDNVAASIMGRNMFGPQRGEWPDDGWKGWWGPNPPYHSAVFVMTHHPRPPMVMEGGTTFNFVTGTPAALLEKAKLAAGGKDIRLNGGVQIVRQFLQAGLVDHLHLAVSPVVLGAGESLLSGIDLPKLGYTSVEVTPGEGALHLVYKKT
jgi:dihydrofolate reductase